MLTTQRLLLRPMKDEDAYNLYQLNSDPDVVRYTGDSGCINLTDAQKIITDFSKPQFQKYKMGRFAVLLTDGTFAGWCGLKFHPEISEVDLGYRFHKRVWGQGFATEASRATLQYGFGDLGLQLITARAMPANVASIKVLQKLGMTFRGLVTESCEPRGFLKYDLSLTEFNK